MAKPYPQVILLGDSLFQHSTETTDGFSFQSAIQAHCIRRFDVINRGFSGYNTANVLKLLPDIFPTRTDSGPKIDYLLVLLGANDACRHLPTTSQHVPMDQYRENLTKILTHPNLTAHNPKILLVTPPPLDQIRLTVVDTTQYGHAEATRYASISAEYSQTAREVASAVPGVVLIDLWKVLMDYAISKTPGFKAGGPLLGSPESGQRGGLEDLLPDGLHLSAEAYKIFAQNVLPHIKVPVDDNEDLIFPGWREMNPQSG